MPLRKPPVKKERKLKSQLTQNFINQEDKIELAQFRDSLLDLFSDIMKEDSVSMEVKSKLARLRARVEIELKKI